jgi:hypothetical protein
MNTKKFSRDLKKASARFSQSIGVEEETILEAVFFRYLAEGNAKQKVFGPHDVICTELQFDADGKYLKGRELYQLLEKMFLVKFTQERIDSLEGRKKSTLTDIEKEFLYDHRPKKINREAYHKAGAERALMLQKIEREQGAEAAQKWADENPFPVKRYIGK